jgi:hypothetical protein
MNGTRYRYFKRNNPESEKQVSYAFYSMCNLDFKKDVKVKGRQGRLFGKENQWGESDGDEDD